VERDDELRALTRLAAAEIGGGAAGVESVHDAIARRVFAAVGPAGTPVRHAHDAIARGVYASVRGGVALAGALADRALARRDAGDGRAISRSPRGAQALAVLSGLSGDALAATGSPLQGAMTLRVDGAAMAPADLARVGTRAVVFVHGLMESEHVWRPDRGYGARLERDLGATPLYVRFNSGLHVSENGRALADLLERLVAERPAIEQIALVGHSMGGLVARSACAQAAERGDAWPARVRHVVSLGTPHTGAPLAQGLHIAAWVLHALPETRPFARLLRRRSAGIRDLRHGSLVDADWTGCEPDALRAAAIAEVPLLDGALHCFVAATITRDARHPLGVLLGDALVLPASAGGRGRARTLGFRTEDGAHVGGAHHLALLDHPVVYERLLEWLSQSPSQALRPPPSSHISGKKASSSSRSPGRR
jgi:pimeloyl-ACP methyl ester carboxylesterase